MSDSALIPCIWTGEVFRPASAFHLRRAREAFGAGEVALLEAQNERSARSHRHYFASIFDAWNGLPERLAGAPYAASAEALRKHALIATGWHDVQTIDAGSKAAAARVAAALSAIHRDYCITAIEGQVVRCFTARSQSTRAMGARDFQKSKDDVLSWISALSEPQEGAA